MNWKGKKYFDGGLADSIPVAKAIRDGSEKNLIILTQPAGFQKEYEKSYDLVIRFLGKQYPKLVDVLKSRHLRYNEELSLCEKLETEGKAVVIRPAYSMDNMEKDLDQIRANYQHGYDTTLEKIDMIRTLF